MSRLDVGVQQSQGGETQPTLTAGRYQAIVESGHWIVENLVIDLFFHCDWTAGAWLWRLRLDILGSTLIQHSQTSLQVTDGKQLLLLILHVVYVETENINFQFDLL